MQYLSDLSFQAALLNVLLMSGYVWIDYGRGFVSSHPEVTNALFITFGWAYIVNQLMYLVSYSGSMPWPAGWTILSEWLGFFGSFTYAATSLLYSDEKGTYITVVCTVEALGAMLYIASAITAAAGWWLDRPFSIERGVKAKDGPLAVRVARDPVMWAHLTNFVPAVVYVSSSLTVLETHFARPASRADAGAPAFAPLLRQLSRIYWYGDVLWLFNGLIWLWLVVRDFDGGDDEKNDSQSGSGDAVSNSTSAPLASLADSLLANVEVVAASAQPLNLQSAEVDVDDDNFSSASAVTSPSVDGYISSAQIGRAKRGRRAKAPPPEKPSRILRQTTPYEVLGPCKRTARCLFRVDATESFEISADAVTATGSAKKSTGGTPSGSATGSPIGLRMAVISAAVASASASASPRSRAIPANENGFSLRLPSKRAPVHEELEMLTFKR